MIHLATDIAAAHYNDLFHPDLSWPKIGTAISLSITMLSVLIYFFGGARVPDNPSKGTIRFLKMNCIVMLLMFVSTSFFGTIGFINDSGKPSYRSQMSDNIKQKYGAAIAENSKLPDGDMTVPKQYDLVLPDGTKGTYLVKWNKETSEPTIINAPSLPPKQ